MSSLRKNFGNCSATPRHPTYSRGEVRSARTLKLDREDVSPDELIRHMAEQPRLIRRPLIHTGDRLFVGTDKTAMAEAFPGYNP